MGECAAEIYADLTLKSTFDEVGQTCKLEGRRATEDDYVNAYEKLAKRSQLVGKISALTMAALTRQNANIVHQAASNATDKAAGFSNRPKGDTWHHHHDGKSIYSGLS